MSQLVQQRHAKHSSLKHSHKSFAGITWTADRRGKSCCAAICEAVRGAVDSRSLSLRLCGVCFCGSECCAVRSAQHTGVGFKMQFKFEWRMTSRGAVAENRQVVLMRNRSVADDTYLRKYTQTYVIYTTTSVSSLPPCSTCAEASNSSGSASVCTLSSSSRGCSRRAASTASACLRHNDSDR